MRSPLNKKGIRECPFLLCGIVLQGTPKASVTMRDGGRKERARGRLTFCMGGRSVESCAQHCWISALSGWGGLGWPLKSSFSRFPLPTQEMILWMLFPSYGARLNQSCHKRTASA
jgi:hypothetical protein